MLKLTIAVGQSVRSTRWKKKDTNWAKLVKKLSKPVRTPETMAEYNKLSKPDRGAIKDVGGYVGGHLRGGKRSPKNVVFRQLLTLDVDFAGMDFCCLLYTSPSPRD